MDRIMEWNYFFSTLAQACGALVGIIGAFTIAKLLNDNEDSELKKSLLFNLFIKKNELIDKFKLIDFDEYNRNRILDSPELWDAVEKTTYHDCKDEKMKVQLYLDEVKNLYPGRDNLTLVSNVLEGYTSLDPEEDEYEYRLMNPGKMKLQLDRIYHNIESLRIESEKTIKEFTVLSELTKSKQITLTTLMKTIIGMGFAIFVFVIYPLSFLPIPKDVVPEIVFTLSNIWDTFACIGGLFLIILSVFTCIFIHFLVKLVNNTAQQLGDINKHITDKELNLYGYCSRLEGKKGSAADKKVPT